VGGEYLSGVFGYRRCERRWRMLKTLQIKRRSAWRSAAARQAKAKRGRGAHEERWHGRSSFL